MAATVLQRDIGIERFSGRIFGTSLNRNRFVRQVLPVAPIPMQEGLADVRARVSPTLFDASVRHVPQTLQHRLHHRRRLCVHRAVPPRKI